MEFPNRKTAHAQTSSSIWDALKICHNPQLNRKNNYNCLTIIYKLASLIISRENFLNL